MYNLSSHDSRWSLTICSLLLFLVSNWLATCFINAIRLQFFIQLFEKWYVGKPRPSGILMWKVFKKKLKMNKSKMMEVLNFLSKVRTTCKIWSWKSQYFLIMKIYIFLEFLLWGIEFSLTIKFCICEFLKKIPVVLIGILFCKSTEQ